MGKEQVTKKTMMERVSFMKIYSWFRGYILGSAQTDV